MLEGQRASPAAAEILSRARDARSGWSGCPASGSQAMAESGVHQGVVARLREFAYATLEEVLARRRPRARRPWWWCWTGCRTPTTSARSIRSADALGAHGVVLPKDRSVGVTAAVARASAGAVEHVPVARVTNLSRALEELKEAGLWVAAADPEGDQALWDARLDGPLALVIGAEGAGVRPGVLEHSDLRLRIPMAGRVGSLNASVSAAMLLYEVARQRGRGAGRSLDSGQVRPIKGPALRGPWHRVPWGPRPSCCRCSSAGRATDL